MIEVNDWRLKHPEHEILGIKKKKKKIIFTSNVRNNNISSDTLMQRDNVPHELIFSNLFGCGLGPTVDSRYHQIQVYIQKRHIYMVVQNRGQPPPPICLSINSSTPRWRSTYAKSHTLHLNLWRFLSNGFDLHPTPPVPDLIN